MSFDQYIRAGRIASAVREEQRQKYHVGLTLFEICESIEAKIREMQGLPAFPVNVSLNDVAAHYTAEPNDAHTVKEGDVLKIDIGVHIDGFVADTAVTVCYDPRFEGLVKSTESALAEALHVARVNTKASDIGKIIESTVSKFGFKPIQNLSGHSLQQYTVHAGKTIPNIRGIGSSFALSSTEVYAIEPFATLKEGLGIVYEGRTKNIFGISSRKPSKDKATDDFLDFLWSRFRTLPFALRWLLDKYEEKEARKMIEILLKKRNIHAYPILVEGHGKIVAQAEHTIIPKDSGVNVITA